MNTEQFEIYSVKNTRLHCVCHTPEGDVSAVLFLVHGLGEHSGRYEELAKIFTHNGLAVFAFDHRGHGKSEGKRGHAQSIEQLVEDVEHAMMKCRSLFLETPIFLFGHSMGGQIVANYLDKVKSKEVSGALISSALFKLADPPSTILTAIAIRMASIFPSFNFPNGLDAADISSIEEEVKAYKTDALVHNKISLALFDSLFSNGLRLCQQSQEVKIPVLVCHGDSDKITDPAASQLYANQIGEKAAFNSWKGAYHEPHHDYDKEAVIQFYCNWVKKQM